MKSSFLFFIILGALIPFQVFAQSKVITKTSLKTEEVSKTDFDKFYERLSIGYFGALTTPPLEDWDSNNAAISPEWQTSDNCPNCDTYAFGIWNQLNFGYDFGSKLRFNIMPRFTVFFDTPKDQYPGERGNVILEDALVGFSGVVYTSDDKKVNLWIRPGVRLPTSHNSRHYNDAEFGHLTYITELTGSLTYDFNPEWQVGLFSYTRHWIFENRYNTSRHRLYFAPNVGYKINDTTRIQAYYENIIENNKRWKSINGKDPVYKSYWQNAYVGISKDLTPKLNVFPYLSAFVNDVPFSARSFWIGMWISYTIK